MYLKYLAVVIFSISLFSGCTSIKQEKLGEVFQSNNAIEIKNDYKEISKFIINFKEKLDKRNPNAYSKDLAPAIYTQIDKLENTIELKYNNNSISSYKGYLQIAFSKDDIKNRNDYLILGLYKMMYEAYNINDSMKLTAFAYSEEKLQIAYKNLQVLTWKLKVDKDLNGDYLFLTWQNNWQIELEKKVNKGLNPSWEDIQNLEHIKNGKESIFTYSNFSYENLLNTISYRVNMSLKRLGVEPTEMGVQAIKSLFIFL